MLLPSDADRTRTHAEPEQVGSEPLVSRMTTSRLATASEGAVQEPVRHLVDQKRVDFVVGSEQFVGDTHEVFDHERDFVEAERNRTARLAACRAVLPRGT